MRLNKLYLIVFFILISLTLSMVNASQDISPDNLTINDEETPMENMDDSNFVITDPREKNDNLIDADSIHVDNNNINNFELAHTVLMDKDYNSDVIYISFYNIISGDFKVFVDDTLRYSHKITPSDYDSDSMVFH